MKITCTDCGQRVEEKDFFWHYMFDAVAMILRIGAILGIPVLICFAIKGWPK